MNEFKRYAVFYVPDAGPLMDFCSAWLGWDPINGSQRVAPIIEGLPLPVDVIIQTPRNYGFHGTIKPPFRLAANMVQDELVVAFDTLARSTSAITLQGLELSRMGRFLALTPLGDVTALNQLAANIVRGLDRFRAPLTDTEIARRNPERLKPNQRSLLLRWGHPYVMEEFRYHMTLSGRLRPDDLNMTMQALAPHLEPLLPSPVAIDSLCLVGEDKLGRHHLIKRSPLSR